ncbi:MAG TPA: stage III sporulation protein SpoIIIAB [Virgibacillus sp.]|nr:stage III sporulation protein SpoIIIAB [Virgibacillus sp.]
MFKIIGALCIIGSSSWIGWSWSRDLERRTVQIRQCINAVQMLESEMRYSQLTLQDAFQRLARRLPHPIYILFENLVKDLDDSKGTLYTIWEKEVTNFLPITAMRQDEKEILLQFGQTLGQHDMVQQEKHIRLALSHLERVLQSAINDEYKYSKMGKSLGILTGIFFVLILI